MIRGRARRAVPAERFDRAAGDPARDAARLLGWVGLAVLMVGAPLVSVLSRSALSIALPVGAAILGAGYAMSVSAEGLRAVGRALAAPIGTLALFLAAWAVLSLAWTPFPELAAPRLAATLATALLAAVAIAHLPERRAPLGSRGWLSPLAPLALLPAGVAVTAASLAALALAGPASMRGGTEFEPSLVESSAITVLVLAWPALGALALAGRWRLAGALAALVAATLLAAGAILASAVFALAALLFAVTLRAPGAAAPRRVALAAAASFAALVLLAPLLPFVLDPLARALPPVGRSTVAAMADWRALVAAEPARLLTGHGLDAARHGVAAGFLPPHAPRSVLFEAWYDLGLLGAAALAAVFASAFVAAGRAAPAVAPALVAGLAAVLAVAVLGVATTQPWFVTLVSLQAVALALLARAGRGLRPPVRGPGWEDDDAHPGDADRLAGHGAQWPETPAETAPPGRLRPIRNPP